eukprot:gene7445-11768_t
MKTTQFTDHFLQLKSGIKIHYIEWKTTEKIQKNDTTLFFVHGTNQTAHTWDELVELLLPQGFNIICYEHRGHGDSSWSDDYSLSKMTKDLEESISLLQLKFEKLIICGMSLGGILSLNYVTKLKENLLGLVIIDITPHVEDKEIKTIRTAVAQSFELDSFEAFVEWAMKYNPTRSKENLTSRLQYSLKKLESGKWTWKHDPKFISTLQLEESKNLWEELKLIKSPTLIVKGESSKVTTDENIEKLRKSIPNSTRYDK